MMRPLHLLPAACLVVLPAAAATSPFQTFAARLAHKGEGVLVVLEGQEPGHLTRALEQGVLQEALIPLLIQVRHLPPDEGATELAQREGWRPEPRWALLDPKGRVLATDTVALPAEALAERFEAAGWVRPERPLEALLARSPEHTQALEDLLGIQMRMATLRMQPRLKPAPEGAKRVELIRPLSEEEDGHIWGPVATTLERLLKDERARPVEALTPRLARFSPRLQRVAQAALPGVQARLLRQPDSQPLWQLWTFMAACAGRFEPGPVVEACPPVPGLRTELPPANALTALLESARDLEAWGAIRDLLQPRFERERDPDSGEARTVILYSRMTMDGEPGPWHNGHGALVEALLHLGERRKAEAIVEELVNRGAYQGVYHHAARVAETCGETALAAAWREKEAKLTAAKGDPR